MNKFYSLSKIAFIGILVAIGIKLNWTVSGTPAVINGLLAGLALIQSWIIYEYEVRNGKN